MKILTVAGKVDSRALVYLIARALNTVGMTAIVTDDGAYRRLYKGESLQGNVSGIDVFVNLKVNESLMKLTSSTGVNYDYIIVVSTNYIPEKTDGLIVCHGIDNSLSQYIESIPQSNLIEQPKKKGLFSKKEDVVVDNREPQTDIEIVNNIDDNFNIKSGIPVIEMYISYNKPVQKYLDGILLNDKLMEYVYGCEETKSLNKLDDKAINEKLASLVAPILGISVKELNILMNKDSYLSQG